MSMLFLTCEAPKKISDIVNEIHKEKGIDIYLNTSIDNIKYKNNIYDVSLTNGIKIKFDLIIVGIGSIPNTDIFSNKEIKASVLAFTESLITPSKSQKTSLYFLMVIDSDLNVHFFNQI